MPYPLQRAPLLQALRNALEPLDYVHAMWEGGAASFKRVDEWSDIDLQVAADDERVAEVVAVVEQTLTALTPITLRYEIPQPAWHGHWQAFYQLEQAGPFLMLDFVVMKRSATNKLLQPEIHGDAVIHFDKINFVVAPPFDQAAFLAKLHGRVATLRVMFPLFQSLTLKELHRGNALEALAFYQGYVLRPLVELLRIIHSPTRYDFHTRYTHYDLPSEVVQRLQALFYVAHPTELAAKREQGEMWFNELLTQIDFEAVAKKLV